MTESDHQPDPAAPEQATAADLASLPGFLCSKALDVREIETGLFVLVDPLGGRSTTFRVSNHAEMLAKLKNFANVVPLCHGDGALVLSAYHPRDGQFVPWSLEEPYVARIPDSYRLWLTGRGDRNSFDAKQSLLPLAYSEAGFGSGSRDLFEQIHAEMLRKAAEPSSLQIPRELLMAYLHHVQVRRLCDDLLALVDRSATAFQRVLRLMRRLVRENAHALDHLKVGEIQHSSPVSADIATHVTVAVVSAVTSMDVVTRLVAFINATDLSLPKFRPPGTTYFADLSKMAARTLPRDVLERIQTAWAGKPDLAELTQFRHDLIHSTTALEIERHVYVGRGTAEVNDLALHYAQIPARDCETSGQPIRFLGREYFTSDQRSIDEVLHSWLATVVEAHATTAAEIRAFVDAARTNATHVLPGT